MVAYIVAIAQPLRSARILELQLHNLKKRTTNEPTRYTLRARV